MTLERTVMLGFVTFRLGLVELAPDSTGGAATYGRAMRGILSELSGELGFELIRLVNESTQSSISGLDDSVVTYQKWPGPPSLVGRLFSRATRATSQSHRRLLPQVLGQESIDLVWFLAPNQVIAQVRDVPLVMTVWDLAHREVQGFPEFSSGSGWAVRESWYTQNIGRAFHVVTDSTHTGKSLERVYGLYPENWSAVRLPLPPHADSDSSLSSAIETPYFYYPASFWPHKNHKVLIDALTMLDDSRVCLVFTGTDEGMENALKDYVERMHVSPRVIFLGRVTDAQVQGLIAGSRGVLMPSLLGPTNYPPLEALRLGVPSVVSTAHHFDAIPESVFRIADPQVAAQWAEHMAQLMSASAVSPGADLEHLAKEKVARILESFRKVHGVYHLD